jgi:hypothetical protein
MIQPGHNWANEISGNLETANIIIFLISASFLNSDYCMNIEANTAIGMHKQGRAILIPIVVRPCAWGDSELSRIQGLPTDAQPITSWANEDEAWVDVVQGLQKAISRLDELSVSHPSASLPHISLSTLKWLDDTEITLSHRRVNKISLKDIYVTPDVEFFEENNKETIVIKNISEGLTLPGHHIISGEEQQGKTSLLKYIYLNAISEGDCAVYLNAESISKSDPEIAIEKALNEQYTGLSYERFITSSKQIILIDNLDNISLNKKFRNVFLENINSKFDNIIITCHKSFVYLYSEIPAINSYQKADLLGLGHKKREEMVRKWISLGAEENIDEAELYTRCDDLKSRLNTVIKKNIVPARPIYVLMLLQMFEANAQLNLELTSYGHCYQQLIYQAFDKAKISKLDFEKYMNVLTELSWWIFTNGIEPNHHQLDSFFHSYSSTYLAVDQTEVISKLSNHAILEKTSSKIGFKYPYIYYFFVGKKIAESYSDSSEVESHVKNLLEKLHREDYANILIFITHHTKSSWVLTEIKTVLGTLFDTYAAATLSKSQLTFMNDFMKKIPELILEQREIQNERDAENERLDKIELGDRNEGPETEGESPDILARINKTFKGMEVAGQIIRNRHASLTRGALSDLALSGVSTGLRFLEYFIKISDTSRNEVVKLIANHLEANPSLSNKEIEKHAEHAYLHLTYGVINAVVRKIASSVGSKEALEVYTKLEEDSGTPAFALIRQAIELQFNKTLKIDRIEECVDKIRDNPVCIRILKEMIIQHIYMFPVEFREKQQLSTLLGISVRGQRLMDLRKTGKA